MAGTGTVVVTKDSNARDRRKRARNTAVKRTVGLIGGIILLILIIRGIQAMRSAGLHELRVDRPFAADSVHTIRLTRSESTITDVLKDDPDTPVAAGETVRTVSLDGRAKLINVDARGVPTRIILKVTSLYENTTGTEQLLLENSEDIGITRRLGGVFDIACKTPLGSTVEEALSFALIEFMRPIPRDLRFNALVVESERRRVLDEWDLDPQQLKVLGQHLLGGTVRSAEGQAQLPKREIIGDRPCLVLLTHSEFKGAQVPVPVGYRSFGCESFSVSTAHSLPLDFRQPAISRSTTTILKGTGSPRQSQVAEVRITKRIKVVEEIE